MNALNFGELKQQLGILIDRNPNNGRSWLGDKINDAYLDIGNMFRFDFLRRTAYLQITAPNTTGTVAVSSQGTTVTGTGTSFDENMVDQKILLNGQAYVISAVASTTSLTLARAFEGSSALTAETTAIYYDAVQLPWGCDYPRVERIRDPKNEINLVSKTKSDYDAYFPNPTATGNPEFYCFTGYKEDRFPASGTTALQAGTSTTSAILTGGAGVDDHYNDWYIINTTREKVSRVTNFDTGTQACTISPAIAGQVVTDTVYLKRRAPYINFYSLPDSAQNLILTYYKMPDKLVNDYDVPFEIPERFHRAIYLRAACHSNLILDDGRKQECQNDYADILQDMNNEYNYFAGQRFKKEAIDESVRNIEYDVYKYPLG